MSVIDSIEAATAHVHGLAVVTCNVAESGARMFQFWTPFDLGVVLWLFAACAGEAIDTLS